MITPEIIPHFESVLTEDEHGQSIVRWSLTIEVPGSPSESVAIRHPHVVCDPDCPEIGHAIAMRNAATILHTELLRRAYSKHPEFLKP